MKSESKKPRMAGAPRAIVCLAVMLAMGPGGAAAEVVTYPAPAGEPLSTDYEVWADGKKVDVYTARVLDPPFAGKQWDYGGPYSFANFDMAGRVTVRITSKRSLRDTVIRPQSPPCSRSWRKRRPYAGPDAGRPAQAQHRAGRQEGAAAAVRQPAGGGRPRSRATPGVIYFGPGIHKPGRIDRARQPDRSTLPAGRS